MIFLLSLFLSRFQQKQFSYVCTAKVCHGEFEHVHSIWGTSHFAYVELRVPLDFGITRLTCMSKLFLIEVLKGVSCLLC